MRKAPKNSFIPQTQTKTLSNNEILGIVHHLYIVISGTIDHKEINEIRFTCKGIH